MQLHGKDMNDTFNIYAFLLTLISFAYGNDDINSVCAENSSPKSSKQLYSELRKNLESIRDSCGEVCDTTISGVPGKYYNFIEKKVDCKALFENDLIDKPSEFPRPLKKIPKYLMKDFTYDGRLAFKEWYLDDTGGLAEAEASSAGEIHWSKQLMDWHFEAFDKGGLAGSYGLENVKNIFRHITEVMPVKDQHVLVIGTQRPWLETLILRAGAKHVTILEYNKLIIDHPQLTPILPDAFSAMFLNGTLPVFDVMVTFSSLEHSGLGRYGDALNPWGDLIAMSRAWCAMRPGAKALVGVPTGPDTLSYNSHRIYGPLLYSHLFANWKQVYTETDYEEFRENCNHCYQPLHIVEKM